MNMKRKRQIINQIRNILKVRRGLAYTSINVRKQF